MKGALGMNGLKYIREKSNFSRDELAKRMGVTGQTLSLWEKGRRKPNYRNLMWLCDFYGLDDKWFGELSDDDILELDDMWLYRHFEGDKEYYSFKPNNTGKPERKYRCGELWSMLDEIYAESLNDKKSLMERIESFINYYDRPNMFLHDRIMTTNNAVKSLNNYLDLLYTIEEIGKEDLGLKVPFSREIKTVIYAMMVSSDQYTVEGIKEANSDDFESEFGLVIDEEYMKKLIEIMSNHWQDTKAQTRTIRRK